MNIDLVPYYVFGLVLLASVACLALWRKVLANQEDDTLHVLGGSVVQHQKAVSHKIDVLDNWGKALTIVFILYALVIAAIFVYAQWVNRGVSG